VTLLVAQALERAEAFTAANWCPNEGEWEALVRSKTASEAAILGRALTEDDIEDVVSRTFEIWSESEGDLRFELLTEKFDQEMKSPSVVPKSPRASYQRVYNPDDWKTSMWMTKYINGDMTSDTDKSKKLQKLFRKRFRLPYASFVELCAFCKESGEFDKAATDVTGKARICLLGCM
jgi:hypothetical protein